MALTIFIAEMCCIRKSKVPCVIVFSAIFNLIVVILIIVNACDSYVISFTFSWLIVGIYWFGSIILNLYGVIFMAEHLKERLVYLIATVLTVIASLVLFIYVTLLIGPSK